MLRITDSSYLEEPKKIYVKQSAVPFSKQTIPWNLKDLSISKDFTNGTLLLIYFHAHQMLWLWLIRSLLILLLKTFTLLNVFAKIYAQRHVYACNFGFAEGKILVVNELWVWSIDTKKYANIQGHTSQCQVGKNIYYSINKGLSVWKITKTVVLWTQLCNV